MGVTPDPPTGRGTFQGEICRLIIINLPMSALLIVRLPPWANVPVQRTRVTNAFAVARGDKTTMRPSAKLLSALVPCLAPRARATVSGLLAANRAQNIKHPCLRLLRLRIFAYHVIYDRAARSQRFLSASKSAPVYMIRRKAVEWETAVHLSFVETNAYRIRSFRSATRRCVKIALYDIGGGGRGERRAPATSDDKTGFPLTACA